MKKVNKSDGGIEIIAIILKSNKGPFLSTNIPKIGPKINTATTCIIPANCKAFPFIPIKTPNVLPVLIIKDIGIFIKNENKIILQYLKLLITLNNFCLEIFLLD